MREGERLEKLWGDKNVWEREMLEKCKCEIKKNILTIIIRNEKKKDNDVDADVA